MVQEMNLLSNGHLLKARMCNAQDTCSCTETVMEKFESMPIKENKSNCSDGYPKMQIVGLPCALPSQQGHMTKIEALPQDDGQNSSAPITKAPNIENALGNKTDIQQSCPAHYPKREEFPISTREKMKLQLTTM